MRLLASILLLITCGCSAQVGTWREGYKSAYVKAFTFKSWDALYDWAEAGESTKAPPIVTARATDLIGQRRTYTNTYAAGFRDYRIGLWYEMMFIGKHNVGDTQEFYRMTIEWMKMQDLDAIIPPGHF